MAGFKGGKGATALDAVEIESGITDDLLHASSQISHQPIKGRLKLQSLQITSTFDGRCQGPKPRRRPWFWQARHEKAGEPNGPLIFINYVVVPRS